MKIAYLESVIPYYRLLAVRKQPKTPRKSREQKKLIVWEKKQIQIAFLTKKLETKQNLTLKWQKMMEVGALNEKTL